MSRGRMSNVGWHVEKRKGFNDTYRKCFNCYYFDDGSCNKKMIPVTSNNAKFCSSYKINNKEKSVYLAVPIYKNAKRALRTIKQGDYVELYDYTLNSYIVVNTNSTDKILVGMINKLVDKNRGSIFFYDCFKYKIKRFYESTTQTSDDNNIIIEHHKERMKFNNE